MQDVDKELQIAKNIRSLIAVETFALMRKAIELANESNDPQFDAESFNADYGLCYINMHEELLKKHIRKKGEGQFIEKELLSFDFSC